MRHFIFLLCGSLACLTPSLCPAALSFVSAQVEETPAIFACDGTIKSSSTTSTRAEIEPIDNVGFVVNFVEQTVSFSGSVAHIDKLDAANIHFHSDETDQDGTSVTIDGDVDRVTGALSAERAISATRSGKPYKAWQFWEMFCKPAKRML